MNNLLMVCGIRDTRWFLGWQRDGRSVGDEFVTSVTSCSPCWVTGAGRRRAGYGGGVARIELPTGDDDGDGDELLGLWTLNPPLSAAAAGLSAAVYDCDLVDLRTRELMRMTIAGINHCTVCLETRMADPDAGVPTEDDYANVASWRTWPGFSDAERVAISFAELFATDHLALDDTWFEGARQHFTDGQLHAMGIMAGSWIALGRMQTVFDVHAACPLRL